MGVKASHVSPATTQTITPTNDCSTMPAMGRSYRGTCIAAYGSVSVVTWLLFPVQDSLMLGQNVRTPSLVGVSMPASAHVGNVLVWLVVVWQTTLCPHLLMVSPCHLPMERTRMIRTGRGLRHTCGESWTPSTLRSCRGPLRPLPS